MVLTWRLRLQGRIVRGAGGGDVALGQHSKVTPRNTYRDPPASGMVHEQQLSMETVCFFVFVCLVLFDRLGWPSG